MSRRDAVLCLDLNVDRVAALEVAAGRIRAWTIGHLAPDSLRGGDPRDPAQLAADLRSALRPAGIRATRARVTLSDDATVVRVTSLPRMPRRHLRGAVRYLAEQQTPFPTDRSALAWDVIEEGPEKITISLAVAWRDVVQRLAAAVAQAGFKVESIEPRSIAVARALGLDQALILDTEGPHARLTYASRLQAPFADQLPLRRGAEWEVLDRLLARALQGQRGKPPPVLLAGELETAATSGRLATLAVEARPASLVLNGRGPLRPEDLPGGALLAPLGLSMQRERSQEGPRFAVLNLLTGLPEARPQRRKPGPRARTDPLTLATVALGAAAAWSLVGAAVAALLGWWHPHLPAAP